MDNCWAVAGNGGNACTLENLDVKPRAITTGGNGGFASGGAIAQLNGDLIVSDCTFFNNYTIGGNGGNGHDGGAGGARRMGRWRRGAGVNTRRRSFIL